MKFRDMPSLHEHTRIRRRERACIARSRPEKVVEPLLLFPLLL